MISFVWIWKNSQKIESSGIPHSEIFVLAFNKYPENMVSVCLMDFNIYHVRFIIIIIILKFFRLFIFYMIPTEEN